jgi:hypothetical protein
MALPATTVGAVSGGATGAWLGVISLTGVGLCAVGGGVLGIGAYRVYSVSLSFGSIVARLVKGSS